MVKICSDTYEGENEKFKTYPFELSAFQKYAIEAIENGKHILITAHTGSGKHCLQHMPYKNSVHLAKKLFIHLPLKVFQIKNLTNFPKNFPKLVLESSQVILNLIRKQIALL